MDAHCYFDHQLFAIYCPQHYFAHFLSKFIDDNVDKLAIDAVQGLMNGNALNRNILNNKRKMMKLSKSTDVCDRYQSSVDVWDLMMTQHNKHYGGTMIHSTTTNNSKEASIDSVNIANATYLTRA